MTRSAKVLLCLVVTAIALIGPRVSFAKHNASILRISPATDGGKYINVHQSKTLKKWGFNVGVYGDYAFEPFEFQSVEGVRRRGIVDDLLTTNVQGAVAFTNWFTVGANLPIVLWETFYDPFSTASQVPKQTFKGKLGDAKIEAKFRLLDVDRYHFGISIIPFVYLPVGDSDHFLGTGMFSPGVMLVFDTEVKNRLFFSINAGYRNYSKTQYYSTSDLNPNSYINDTFILNAGLNFRFTDSFALLGEVITEGVMSSLWKNQEQNPAEFLAGIRYTPQGSLEGLGLTVVGGKSMTTGIGSPDFRILAGLSYRYMKKKPQPVPVEVLVEEKISITQRIHFEFDRAVIRPVSYPILNDVVELLLKNQQIRLVRVEGHTDWIGTDEYNLKLSERRANAVREFLIANGISYDRLIAAGYGESRPIADNNTVEGRARNRRTEFTVIQTGDKSEKPAAVIPPPPPLPPPPPPPAPKPAPKPAPVPAPKPAPAPQLQPQPQPVAQPAPSTKYGETKPATPSQTKPSTKYGTTPEAKPATPSQTTPSSKYGEPKTSAPSQTTPSTKYGTTPEAKPSTPSQSTPSTKYGTTPEAKPSTSSKPKSKY